MVLLAVLGLALLHGLVYLFLIPPWEHYDEPTHFEYAWLIAHRAGLPEPGDFDQAMRRRVAGSMQETGFLADRGFEVDLDPPEGPIWIGISQLDEPPLYYVLASFPLRVFPPYERITDQLRAARGVSLVFLLAAVWAAYGLTRELTARGSPLRWMVPLSLALLPGFVDSLSSVNNDAAAAGLFALTLWPSARIAQRGPSAGRLLAAGAAAGLCLVTKSTVFVAPAVPAMAVLLGLARRWKPVTLAAVILASLGAALLAGLSLEGAAAWFRPQAGMEVSRVPGEVPLGSYAVRLDATASVAPPRLVQVLPPEAARTIAGRTVTVGAWLWATEAIQGWSPALVFGRQRVSRPVDLGVEPAFFAVSAPLDDLSFPIVAKIELAPLGGAAQAPPVDVYVDGLMLIVGESPSEEPPQFASPGGEGGSWGGRTFENLARNGSFERSGLRLRPWLEGALETLVGERFYGPPTVIFATLTDPAGSSRYYVSSAANLFRTFWGKFGWGHVPLLGGKPYRPLALFTALGVAGAIAAVSGRLAGAIPAVRGRLAGEARHFPGAVVLVLGAAVAVIWGQALVRGAGSFDRGWIFIPAARYAYPAAVPTLLVLAGGWDWWLGRLQRLLRLPAWFNGAVLSGALLSLAMLALFSVYSFFYIRGPA